MSNYTETILSDIKKIDIHDKEAREYMAYLDDEAWYAQREREGW